jgi:hypothetical protein
MAQGDDCGAWSGSSAGVYRSLIQGLSAYSAISWIKFCVHVFVSKVADIAESAGGYETEGSRAKGG